VNIALDSSCTFIPVDERFKFVCDNNCFGFRKSQFIKRCDRIVITNRLNSKTLILEKDTYSTYKVYKEVSDMVEIVLIKKFIQGENDFYYLEKKFYNEDNEEIRVVDPKWAGMLARGRTFHIKSSFYLICLANIFPILFDYQPKVAFISDEIVRYSSGWQIGNYPDIVKYELDDIVLKNFKVRPTIIKGLRKLGNLEEMKEYIARELSFNLI